MKKFTEVESRSVRCDMEADVVLRIVQLAIDVSDTKLHNNLLH